ncbi:PAS domain S-box protein [bacterium BMS3Abin03]|jgi:PAS domain S-box-containing protein|nr:PAS domain S-box protein [bacterium BMS3Abin03]MCG6959127.1 PAS domain S-box protein [bacterium BMS3Abin03]
MSSELELEEKINKTETLFGWLWELSVDGMRLLDSLGRIMMVNDAYCRVVEKKKEDLVGKIFSEVYAEPERERLLTSYLIDARSNTIKTHFEREDTLWNGKKCWFDFSNSFIEIPEIGKVTLSIIKNITERKRSELELKDSEEKYRTLFNNANDAVFVTLLSEGKTYGDFIEVNEIACERLGYTKEEFLKLSPSAIILPGYIDEFNKYNEKLLKETHVVYELVHRAKDNHQIFVEVSSHLFTYKGKLTVLSVARDITERKKAEKKLSKTSMRLRNLASHLQSVREEERATIAREIHDELGQVLTVLKIQIALLSNKLRKDQKELKDKLDYVSGLIDSTVGKVQRITAKLRPNILDELGLIPAIEWQANEFQNVTGIQCSLSLPAEEVNLEEEKSTAIFRIFQEALTNVMRHSSAKIVSILLQTINNLMILKINDNGIGINNEQLSASKSLGIIGMKERALLLGGEVIIEGTPGKGTEVKVEMPLTNILKQRVDDDND